MADIARSLLAAVNDNARRDDAPPLPEPGGGGQDGGMSDLKKRVGTLEAKVDILIVDVREVKSATHSLREAVAEIRGKISQMPTTWQMATWFVGVSMGLVVLVFAIARAMK